MRGSRSWSWTDADARIVRESRYASRDYPGLAPIVDRFCQEAASRPDRACFGIACPVVGDECTAPNLPWTVNARKLAAEIGIPRTGIINDFVAVGYGIGLLGPSDLATLQEGNPTPHGPIALIGAGTGLGQGFLLWEGDHYRVLPSEGGHGDFAPRGKLADRPAPVPAPAIRSRLLGAAALGCRAGQRLPISPRFRGGTGATDRAGRDGEGGPRVGDHPTRPGKDRLPVRSDAGSLL